MKYSSRRNNAFCEAQITGGWWLCIATQWFLYKLNRCTTTQFARTVYYVLGVLEYVLQTYLFRVSNLIDNVNEINSGIFVEVLLSCLIWIYHQSKGQHALHHTDNWTCCSVANDEITTAKIIAFPELELWWGLCIIQRLFHYTWRGPWWSVRKVITFLMPCICRRQCRITSKFEHKP